MDFLTAYKILKIRGELAIKFPTLAGGVIDVWASKLRSGERVGTEVLRVSWASSESTIDANEWYAPQSTLIRSLVYSINEALRKDEAAKKFFPDEAPVDQPTRQERSRPIHSTPKKEVYVDNFGSGTGSENKLPEIDNAGDASGSRGTLSLKPSSAEDSEWDLHAYNGSYIRRLREDVALGRTLSPLAHRHLEIAELKDRTIRTQYEFLQLMAKCRAHGVKWTESEKESWARLAYEIAKNVEKGNE